MNENQSTTPCDELLVAFIDGEVEAADRRAVEEWLRTDEAVAERLAVLMRGTLPFRAGFDPVLEQAPIAKLVAMIPPEAGARANGGRVFAGGGASARIGRRWFVTAAAACVAGGVAIDRTAGILLGDAASARESEWRLVIANYMMLYTPETLSNLNLEASSQAREIGRVGETMALPLSLSAIEIPGVPFKRAQILQFKGRPLAQIAYLDPKSGPLALCITHEGDSGRTLRTEQRFAMNIAYWSTASHSFLVVGRNTMPELQLIASVLKSRFTA